MQLLMGDHPRQHAEPEASAASKGRADKRRSRATATPTWAGNAAPRRWRRVCLEQLGHPEGGPVAGHGDVRHHGDQQASGLADAVDGGDDRARLSRMVRNGRTSAPMASGIISPSGSAPPPRSPPGAKTSPVPVMISAASYGIPFDQTHRPLDPVVHGRGERVPGRRPVDDAPGDGPLALEPEVRCSQIIAHRPAPVRGRASPVTMVSASPESAGRPPIRRCR